MKNLIVIGVASIVGLAVVGGAGFFGYKMYSELAEYKALGPIKDMRTYSKENFDLKKENKLLLEKSAYMQRQFLIHRKVTVGQAVKRSERKVATSIAAFTPISGSYVLAAMSAQEQLELCQDVQALIKLESQLFESSDPAVVMQQEKICGTYIERKLMPLFKYQMLRVRASMTGSLGHLRVDAEEKFEKARKLLEKWEVPVERELDSYTDFDR
ncbi:hypothetical protein ACMXYX_06525 [Neptuniibacter sp. QD72_48]|uniref:hypothetical protein n=1 Tax=unclassified Neptuniibacter TaxID=2630693 RepID=UPI0039F6846E